MAETEDIVVRCHKVAGRKLIVAFGYATKASIKIQGLQLMDVLARP